MEYFSHLRMTVAFVERATNVYDLFETSFSPSPFVLYGSMSLYGYTAVTTDHDEWNSREFEKTDLAF